MARRPGSARRNWLLGRLGLPLDRQPLVLDRRLAARAHPDKSLPGGPELDFIVDGDRCVVFGKAKWLSGEGRGHGIAGDKGQIQLRREFLATRRFHRSPGPVAYCLRGTVAHVERPPAVSPQ